MSQFPFFFALLGCGVFGVRCMCMFVCLLLFFSLHHRRHHHSLAMVHGTNVVAVRIHSIRHKTACCWRMRVHWWCIFRNWLLFARKYGTIKRRAQKCYLAICICILLMRRISSRLEYGRWCCCCCSYESPCYCPYFHSKLSAQLFSPVFFAIARAISFTLHTIYTRHSLQLYVMLLVHFPTCICDFIIRRSYLGSLFSRLPSIHVKAERRKETKEKQNYNAIIMCWHFGRVYFYIVCVCVFFFSSPFPLTSLNQIGVVLLYTIAHIAMCIAWLKNERSISTCTQLHGK